MDSLSPKSMDIPEKHKKYDRQLRLWGDHGQLTLEAAHVCLINATAVGTEILKSLVLPGVGSFTIVDTKLVSEDDVDCNFFLKSSDLGQSRAQSVVQLLLEMNEDVRGDYIVESVTSILANNSTFFNKFSVVVATMLDERELCSLSKLLWENDIPLISCSSYGFFGVSRIQIREHAIVESHPDYPVSDLRIVELFPALREHVSAIDLDSMELKDHAHVPYVIILAKYLDKWRSTHGGQIPSTYPEKNAFKELIRCGVKKNENGNPVDEENFNEAIKAVNTALNPSHIPAEVKTLFSDDKCVNLDSKSKPFWVMVRALREFVEGKEDHLLPLAGSLPDMTADTQRYISLQKVYKVQADSDVKKMYTIVQQLLQQYNLPQDLVNESDIKLFCKHASELRLLRGLPIFQEYSSNQGQIASFFVRQLEEPDNLMEIYVLNRAMERFYLEFKEYPGHSNYEMDIVKFKACVTKLMNELGVNLNGGPLIADDMLHEICRYGGLEIHSVSAFLGGCIAQEVIKLITGQFIPFDNAIIYSALTGNLETFKIKAN